jgi:hypothetical protein
MLGIFVSFVLKVLKEPYRHNFVICSREKKMVAFTTLQNTQSRFVCTFSTIKKLLQNGRIVIKHLKKKKKNSFLDILLGLSF